MKELIEIAIKAAIEAGNEIIKVYSDPESNFNVEKKADNSPLTIADKKSHIVIEYALSETIFPILSEEGKEISYMERKGWDTLWIVDPLDGTKEFIKKNGEFTVNIALVQNGTPLLGVVYVPVTNELYVGSEDYGSYKYVVNDGAEARLDDIFQDQYKLPLSNDRDNLVVVASKSHLSQETSDYIDHLRQSNDKVELVSKGSSLKICLVAEGKADIYPRFAPTMEWDTAAGHAIAKFAGREIYRVDETTPLCYNKENLLNPWFIVK